MNGQDSRLTGDLIDLIDAVKAVKQPEPPRPADTESTPVLFRLPTPLVDQLTEWRAQAAHQLDRDDVTDAKVFCVLVRMLVTSEELTTQVIDALHEGSEY